MQLLDSANVECHNICKDYRLEFDMYLSQLTAVVRRTIHHQAHSHHSGQFVFIRRGVLTGYTEDHSWLLQSGTIAWIPPEQTHWGSEAGSVELAVIYLPPELCSRLPNKVTLVNSTPLLTALCERLVDENSSLDAIRKAKIMEVFLDEVNYAPLNNLILVLPQDKRLRRVADALVRSPSDRTTLAEWGKTVGATERTLARLFQRETGMSYKEWRDRLLLKEAFTGLASGLNNDLLACSLGFASGECFSHWFRRQTGEAPSRFRRTLLS